MCLTQPQMESGDAGSGPHAGTACPSLSEPSSSALLLSILKGLDVRLFTGEATSIDTASIHFGSVNHVPSLRILLHLCCHCSSVGAEEERGGVLGNMCSSSSHPRSTEASEDRTRQE